MPDKYRLAVKLEETSLGNGVWDKVTVKVPNSSYMLTEVKHENNKLSVLFCYTDGNNYNPMDFSFMLSAFKINPNDVAETDEFLVACIEDSAPKPEKQATSLLSPSETEWFDQQDYKFKYVELEGDLTDEMRLVENSFAGPKCPPRCFD